MGVSRFCVVFDKPDKVYYPGEMVTGRVELVLDSIKKIKGVELKLKGRAKCKWDESETYRDNEGKSHTRTICRQATETFLKSEQVLVGGRDKFELGVGQHTYPFIVMLPIKAPSSFNGTYGGIAYYAKAKIDIPLAFDKQERSGFTVINPLNLNLFPNLRTPYKNEKDKTFCCLCCASGPLTIVVHLPKTGFATSESIPITVEVDNASNVTVNAIHVYLKRDIHWKADGCHKDENVKLQKLRLGGVEQGQSHTWSEDLTIPPTSFPNLDGCSIIKMDHEIHIEADASGMHSDLDMHVPVTIGDIALSEDPNAPIVNPQVQTYPSNVVYNPGMQIPPVGAPTNQFPTPVYPGQNPPPNYLYPGNTGGGATFGIPPLQICPAAPPGYPNSQPGMNVAPNPGFVAPSPYPNIGEIPQPSPQVYPQSNYPTAPYQSPGNPVSVQPYSTQVPHVSPSLPPQPATNPECSQTAPHPPITNTGAGDGFTLPSFESNVKLENTSFLNDYRDSNTENTTATTPLLPSAPSAPPPS